jgi:hypothetical protein
LIKRGQRRGRAEFSRRVIFYSLNVRFGPRRRGISGAKSGGRATAGLALGAAALAAVAVAVVAAAAAG